MAKALASQGAASLPWRIGREYERRPVPKAAQVLAGLRRDGWVEIRRRGSHRLLAKGNRRAVWAWHDGSDLGGPAMALVARQFGVTVDELRTL